MIATEAGMQIECNDKQSQSVFSSIWVSFDPGSNVTVIRELRPVKQRWSRTTTEAGIQIDFNDEQPEKNPVSIRVSFDPGSSVKQESYNHKNIQSQEFQHWWQEKWMRSTKHHGMHQPRSKSV
jgi:hypothetical protein